MSISPAECHEPGDFEYLSDGKCDTNLNKEECKYDGGDCCLEEANCVYCIGEGCVCHETGINHCPGK